MIVSVRIPNCSTICSRPLLPSAPSNRMLSRGTSCHGSTATSGGASVTWPLAVMSSRFFMAVFSAAEASLA